MFPLLKLFIINSENHINTAKSNKDILILSNCKIAKPNICK